MSADSDQEQRTCTNCGKSVSGPYMCWLFHTCQSCVAERSPDRWGDGTIGPGTYRKWRYFPRWHYGATENGEQSDETVDRSESC